MLRHTARPTEAFARFLDLAVLTVSLPLAFGLYQRIAPLARVGWADFGAYWPPLLLTMVAWGGAAWVYRVYDARPHSLRDEFMRIARAMVLVAFGIFALIFFAHLQWVSRLLTGLYFVVALGLICSNRIVLRALAHSAGTSPGSPRYYTVVGSGELAAEIIGKLRSHPEWGMRAGRLRPGGGRRARRPELRDPGAGPGAGQDPRGARARRRGLRRPARAAPRHRGRGQSLRGAGRGRDDRPRRAALRERSHVGGRSERPAHAGPHPHPVRRAGPGRQADLRHRGERHRPAAALAGAHRAGAGHQARLARPGLLPAAARGAATGGASTSSSSAACTWTPRRAWSRCAPTTR